MLNTIIRYIQGYLLIQVTGYSPERFLNLCSRKQIYLWGLEPKENSYEMFITIRGFRKLKPILKKTRTKVTILNRLGLPFFFHKYRKRKVFFFGILFCVIFIYVMSLFDGIYILKEISQGQMRLFWSFWSPNTLNMEC